MLIVANSCIQFDSVIPEIMCIIRTNINMQFSCLCATTCLVPAQLPATPLAVTVKRMRTGVLGTLGRVSVTLPAENSMTAAPIWRIFAQEKVIIFCYDQ